MEEILKKYFFQVQKGTNIVGNLESNTFAINTGYLLKPFNLQVHSNQVC